MARLNADFNSRVHRGDVIALIDPALFQGALQQASADLENARANITAVEAELAKARATLTQTETNYKRQSALVKIGAVSQGVAEAAVEQANPQVKLKQAVVAVARTNLECCTIRSPIDGIVVARNVDVGQTVAASLQAPTIFSIARIFRRCSSTPKPTNRTSAASGSGRKWLSRSMHSRMTSSMAS